MFTNEMERHVYSWQNNCMTGSADFDLFALKTNIQIKMHFIPYVYACHTIVFIHRPVILL